MSARHQRSGYERGAHGALLPMTPLSGTIELPFNKQCTRMAEERHPHRTGSQSSGQSSAKRNPSDRFDANTARRAQATEA
jgi:hypothetical protein